MIKILQNVCFGYLLLQLLATSNARDITRTLDVPLPGNERISKRSLTIANSIALGSNYDIPLDALVGENHGRKIRSLDDPEEDMDTAENIVFRPSFKRRNGFTRTKRSLVDPDDEDEMLLRYRRNAKIAKREINPNSIDLGSNYDIPLDALVGENHGREIRSLDDPEEDMDTAENIVFRPSFKRRNGFTRTKRSLVDPDDEDEMLLRYRRDAKIAKREINPNFKEDDDLETAANMVFRPHFRKESGFRRQRRSASVEIPEKEIDKSEDLESAEDNIVFRPFFRRNKRSLYEPVNIELPTRFARNAEAGEILETAENIVTPF